jgi:hypothetical protein
VHATCEDKSDDVKDSFYEELRFVFGSVYGSLAGSCEHGDEPTGSGATELVR